MILILLVVYLGMSLLQSGIWIIVQAVRDANFLGIETAINSIVRVFVYLPFLVLPVGAILKVKWSRACDSIAFSPLVTSCIGQLACVFPG